MCLKSPACKLYYYPARSVMLIFCSSDGTLRTFDFNIDSFFWLVFDRFQLLSQIWKRNFRMTTSQLPELLLIAHAELTRCATLLYGQYPHYAVYVPRCILNWDTCSKLTRHQTDNRKWVVEKQTPIIGLAQKCHSKFGIQTGMNFAIPWLELLELFTCLCRLPS